MAELDLHTKYDAQYLLELSKLGTDAWTTDDFLRIITHASILGYTNIPSIALPRELSMCGLVNDFNAMHRATQVGQKETGMGYYLRNASLARRGYTGNKTSIEIDANDIFDIHTHPNRKIFRIDLGKFSGEALPSYIDLINTVKAPRAIASMVLYNPSARLLVKTERSDELLRAGSIEDIETNSEELFDEMNLRNIFRESSLGDFLYDKFGLESYYLADINSPEPMLVKERYHSKLSQSLREVVSKVFKRK